MLFLAWSLERDAALHYAAQPLGTHVAALFLQYLLDRAPTMLRKLEPLICSEERSVLNTVSKPRNPYPKYPQYQELALLVDPRMGGHARTSARASVLRWSPKFLGGRNLIHAQNTNCGRIMPCTA